jgi:hypothetical protein
VVVAAQIGGIVSGLRIEVYPYARSASGSSPCTQVLPSSPSRGEVWSLARPSSLVGEGRYRSAPILCRGLDRSPPPRRADKGRYRSLPPWRGKVRMGNRRRDSTPTHTLPHQWGGEMLCEPCRNIHTPVSPSTAEGAGGGEGRCGRGGTATVRMQSTDNPTQGEAGPWPAWPEPKWTLPRPCVRIRSRRHLSRLTEGPHGSHTAATGARPG